MIRLYIDNSEVDYKDVESLDFNLTAQYRDFTRIGSVEGFELDNTANLLTIPATRRNMNVLQGKERTVLSFKVIEDGVQLFDGNCIYATEIWGNDTLNAIALEVFGGNAGILQALEGVSLRDLDLGTQNFTNAAIQTSWGNDCDDENGMFAPVVYGALDSGVENDWNVVDFRYHVYFDAIMRSIASYAGVSIDSNFFTLDIWRKCLFAFGVGEDWKATTPFAIDETYTAGELNDTFTLPQGQYTYTVRIPAGATYVDPDFDAFRINIGGSITDIPKAVDLLHEGEFTVGAAGVSITISGIDSGGGLAGFPNPTTFQVSSEYAVNEGDSFFVASCLPDVEVKVFLKQICEMFNLVLFYNPVTKVLSIEPAFDYVIDGTRYDGFFQRITDTTNALDIDVSEFAIDYRLPYSKLQFAFDDCDNFDKFLSKRTLENRTLFSTETSLQAGEKVEVVGGSLFVRCYSGTIRGVNSASQIMPLLITDNIEGVDNAVEAATFEYDPTFFYITSETQSIDLVGTTYTTAPVCTQINAGGSEGYTMSYSDFTRVSGTTSTTIDGLVSIFYQSHFALLRRMKIVKARLRIDNVMQIDNYRRWYKSRGEYYALTMLENVELGALLRDATLIQYVAQRNTDAVLTEHIALDSNDSKILLNG